MDKNPCIRIGHLNILDHLILGVTGLLLNQSNPQPSPIDLKTVAMNTWPQISDALISQDIDGALIPVPLAMKLYDTGCKLKLLMMAHRGGGVIAKRKSTSLKTIDDFKNKTLLVSSDLSIHTMLLHRMFATAGLLFSDHSNPKADVVYESVPPVLIPDLLANDPDGHVAGFAVSQPFAAAGMDTGLTEPFCTSASLWKDHPCSVFVVGSHFLDNHGDGVAHLISSFVHTAEKLADPENTDVIETAGLFLNLPADTVQTQIAQSGINFNPTALVPDAASFEMIQIYMVDTMGTLNTAVQMDQLIDDGLIRAALTGE